MERNVLHILLALVINPVLRESINGALAKEMSCSVLRGKDIIVREVINYLINYSADSSPHSHPFAPHYIDSDMKVYFTGSVLSCHALKLTLTFTPLPGISFTGR